MACAEGATGWWLRHLPLETARAARPLVSWLVVLAALLGVRVLGSWGRDRSQELSALREGERLVRKVWAAADAEGRNGPWLTREGREIAEQGARARLVLAASATSLAVLLPLMIWFSPILCLALVVVAPALAWTTRRRWRASRTWISAEQTALARHAAEESWSWRGVPEAAASGLGALLARVRREASSRLAAFRRDGAEILVRGQAQTEAAAHAAGWALAALALLGWSRGLVPPSDLLAFLAAALLAYRPIREAGRALPAWHRHRALEMERDRRPPLPPLPPIGPLEVSDLRVFAADGAVLVYGPSFRLPPGSAFLVSGANGSGKTSLLAGLAGWLPCDGIRQRPSAVRVLAQEPVIPPFSPRQWSGEPDPSRLPLATRLFPGSLPFSWTDPVPDGGSRLSRGERARLALVCLTARPADLWLLDEPFSALPYAERSAHLQALREIQGDAAMILSDPLSLDPVGASLVWEPGGGRKGPKVYRLW